MNLSEIKLNEQNFKHFENRLWKPNWDEVKDYMLVQNFDMQIEAWQAAENVVLFEGITINYDSSDSEYSTTPEFPVEIEIEGYEIESEIEADEMIIYYNGFSFRLPFEKSTLADFVAACKICGIDIKLKPTINELPNLH